MSRKGIGVVMPLFPKGQLTEWHIQAIKSGNAFVDQGYNFVIFCNEENLQELRESHGFKGRVYPKERMNSYKLGTMIPGPPEKQSLKTRVDPVVLPVEIVPATPIVVPPIVRFNQGISVLCISHSLALGGAEKSLFYICQGLKEKGMDVTVVAKATGPLTDWYRREGIPIYIGFPTDIFPTAVDPEEFDICLANTTETIDWMRILPKNLPLIWSVRESTWETYRQEFAITREDIDRAAYFTFACHATKQLYKEDLEDARMKTIHNGIKLGQLDTYLASTTKWGMRSAYGYSIEKRLVITASNIGEVKGQMDIVETAHLMKEQGTLENTQFLLIGGVVGEVNEAYEVELVKKIQKYGLQDDVVRIPSTDKISDYYRMADVYLCSSHLESFPRSLLEAMAFSLPIISTDVFGIPEMIVNAVNGLLLQPGDIEKMAKDLVSFATFPGRARALGEKARLRLQERFTQKIVDDAYERLIWNVLSKEKTAELIAKYA